MIGAVLHQPDLLGAGPEGQSLRIAVPVGVDGRLLGRIVGIDEGIVGRALAGLRIHPQQLAGQRVAILRRARQVAVAGRDPQILVRAEANPTTHVPAESTEWNVADQRVRDSHGTEILRIDRPCDHLDLAPSAQTGVEASIGREVWINGEAHQTRIPAGIDVAGPDVDFLEPTVEPPAPELAAALREQHRAVRRERNVPRDGATGDERAHRHLGQRLGSSDRHSRDPLRRLVEVSRAASVGVADLNFEIHPGVFGSRHESRCLGRFAGLGAPDPRRRKLVMDAICRDTPIPDHILWIVPVGIVEPCSDHATGAKRLRANCDDAWFFDIGHDDPHGNAHGTAVMCDRYAQPVGGARLVVKLLGCAQLTRGGVDAEAVCASAREGMDPLPDQTDISYWCAHNRADRAILLNHSGRVRCLHHFGRHPGREREQR